MFFISFGESNNMHKSGDYSCITGARLALGSENEHDNESQFAYCCVDDCIR